MSVNKRGKRTNIDNNLNIDLTSDVYESNTYSTNSQNLLLLDFANLLFKLLIFLIFKMLKTILNVQTHSALLPQGSTRFRNLR